MKKRNAFTLVELIAVITLIGVLSLITVPTVNKSIQKSKEKSLETTKRNLEETAKKYVADNSELLDDSSFIVTFNTLLEKGFIEKLPINAVTDEALDGCILVKETNGKYSYNYDTECKIISLPSD